MTDVDDLIYEVIEKEGGYCNDPSDLGGETCWGITVSVAREHGYTGPMVSLPRSVAEEIYRRKYWFTPKFNRVSVLSLPIARECFDTGVNMGVGKAAEFLQVALNAMNRQGKDYPDINEDGDVGDATLKALASYLGKRGPDGEAVMVTALNCLQGARYIDISRKRPQNEDFTYGWIKNRVKIV